MENPYSFLRSAKVEFFDEGATHKVGNLMTRDFDEELAFGAVDGLIGEARAELESVPPDGVRAILWFADSILEACLENGLIVINGSREWNKDRALRTPHYAVLPPVMQVFSKNDYWIGTEDGAEDFSVTPERLCAAYILRATFSAIDFGYTNGFDDLPVHYLMQASTAFGYLLALRQKDANGIGGVVSSRVKSHAMSQLQSARHQENRQMEQEVRKWWSEHKNDPGMTKDKAATEIAGKVVPLKWRTVRDQLKGG